MTPPSGRAAQKGRLGKLEAGRETHSNAPRRPDGIAGEKPAEVNHVQNVGEVLSVRLKPYGNAIRLEN